MRIGIDIQPLMGDRSGVGQYTFNMISALARTDTKNQYKLMLFRFFTRPIDKLPINLPANFSYGIIKVLPGRVFAKLLNWNLLPPVDLFLGRRVYIFPNFVCWPLLFSKSVVVIYDLSFVLHPQFTSPKNLRFLLRNVPKAVRRAAHIVTISENSKKELVDYYKVSPQRVSVVNPAVSHEVFKPQKSPAQRATLAKYKIKQPYILSVCTLEPRKNLTGVLNAFSQLPDEIKNSHALVLVGGKGWLDEELQAKFDELSKKYSVIKTGYAPDEDLPALYSGARVFAYPSFYEGFGMPPLEAMACGTPVITSNNSSLPEVVGEAGIMVDAHDTKELTKQIERVLSDEKLASQMSKKGLEQAKKFDWDKSARKLIEVIESVSKK